MHGLRSRGLLTVHEAEAIWREAKHVAGRLTEGDPIVGENWTAWRPDPRWTVPSVPAGWDSAQSLSGLG